MRVRVNQYAHQPHPEVDVFKTTAKKYLDYHYSSRMMEERRYLEAYICRTCGAELYVEWITYWNREIHYEKEGTYGNWHEVNVPAALRAKGDALRKLLDQEYKEADEEEKQLRIECKCPVCGTPNKFSDWSSPGRYGNVNTAINREYSKISDAGKANEEVAQLIKMYDLPAASNCETDGTIQNDPEKLKKYILHLLVLETNIVSLSKHLEKLYCERNKNQIYVNRANYAPTFEAMQRREEMQKKLNAAQDAYRKCLNTAAQCEKNKPMPVQIPEPAKPSEPNYQKPGLFNKKKVLAENEAMEAQYRQDMQEYERKCQQRLLDIERKNGENRDAYLRQLQLAEAAAEEARVNMEALRADLESITPGSPLEVCPAKAQQKMIATEIEKTENLLRDTYKARNELYAANVIFSKYRDIVALATFYEYLMSGRCTTLEGPNGAYNLYEAEIRANMIISKLSEIEKSLKNIEQTQYMIYSQLTEMNRTLDEMSSTMDSAYIAISKIETNTSDMSKYMAHISENSDVIAHNSTVTAYYSKLNAELTNALGFMVAMKIE